MYAIERISQAESSARKSIGEAERKAESMLLITQKKADEIVKDAEDKVALFIAKEKVQAHKKADEIIDTAKEKAILEAEILKSRCFEKDETVFRKIMELIV